MAGLPARLGYQQLNPGRYRRHWIAKFMGGNGQELIPGTKLRLSLDQLRFESRFPGRRGVAILISSGSWTAVARLLFLAGLVSDYPHAC